MGSSAFARRYSRNRSDLSSPLGTKMFQFPRCASAPTEVGGWPVEPAGFPHSDIGGSKLTSSSPPLIAGSRVLHRLLVPRHPLYALSNLTSQVKQACKVIVSCIRSIRLDHSCPCSKSRLAETSLSRNNDRKNMLFNIRFSKSQGQRIAGPSKLGRQASRTQTIRE